MIAAVQVVQAIEKRHSVESSSAPTHFQQVFQSLIDMARSTIAARIETISQKVSDRVSELYFPMELVGLVDYNCLSRSLDIQLLFIGYIIVD